MDVGPEDDGPAGAPFPAVLRRYRVAARLTQDRLAELAGLNVRSVSQLERGRVRYPRPETVRLLGRALRLGPAELERFQELARGDYWADRDPGSDPPPGPAVPAQLPGAVATFTGRAAELSDLDKLPGGTGSPAVVVAVVSGTAGVGKTALALHWAHRVAARFPDGQLYVNLRGFDPGDRAMDPAEAVRGFLDALGVASGRVPPGRDAQAARYRSLLAGKRILVLLDNARDADQVRPLLPGAAGCLAVVTSRNQLTSLVVAGAHPVALDVLSRAEAHDLLAARLGAGRVGAEPDAVREIVAACAGLPLALNIAAARARQTSFPLATLAAELREAGRRLDALDTGDTAASVRAVFSSSYTALTPPAARLFRLLGLHPGPDVAVPAAASLLGAPVPQTRRLLAELTRATVLVEHVPGRYTLHDLLRAYATELGRAEDGDDARRAATIRLLDHYTHTAYAADRLLNPSRDPIDIPLTAPAPGAEPERFADSPAATLWFTREQPNLLAALRQAAGTGFDTHGWQLAWALRTHLLRQGHWHDLAAAGTVALHAAIRLRHPAAQADAHRILGRAEIDLGRPDRAHEHLRYALALCAQDGDGTGQARIHVSIASLWERQHRPDRALDHSRQALDLFRAAGHRRGQARALNGVGWYHALLGEHAEALAYCAQAMDIHRRESDRAGQADTLDSLGHVHHHLGDHARAAACYQDALALYRQIRYRYFEAVTLIHLGDAQEAAGRSAAARDAWRSALRILTELDHPDAGTARARLRDGPGVEPGRR